MAPFHPSPKDDHEPTTVGELIDHLQKFDRNLPIVEKDDFGRQLPLEYVLYFDTAKQTVVFCQIFSGTYVSEM